NSPAMVAQREKSMALQGKFDHGSTAAQLMGNADGQKNSTGMPDTLKSGIEQLSGLSMDGVQVHYNSAQPAQLNALAYAQGDQIHVGPGQEKHLPHEAWHVVQQKQGRVKPTVQRVGVQLNDDAGLEQEADLMGAKANTMQLQRGAVVTSSAAGAAAVVQRRLPPGETIETEISLGGGTDTTYMMLYRLMHMEVSQQRLRRALDNTAYADANEAVNDVFPNGKFNADAYAALYAVNQQYGEVLPASQDIRDINWQTLQPALARAIRLAIQCANRGDDIEAVFGPNAEVMNISATYLIVAQRLGGFNQDNFTIDYNGDDAEMGVGGFTAPGSGKIQVSPSMLAKDANTLAVLLLHEGCHEVDDTIIDSGYYGTARFSQMSQRQKKRNAAHYEEVARRAIGNSIYAHQTFQPVAQQQVQGGRRQELIRKVRPANEGLRELWNTSANLHGMMRDIVAGASTLQPQLQVAVVTALKQGFELPTATVDGAPVVTEFDLALMESTTKVFHRAMTAIKQFQRERDPNERDRLCDMSVKELALEAINRVGGFQGLDPAINVTAIDQIRTAVILGLQQADPFPAFGED
ncbi:MAG: DUF4157 domain-containing protein, partial [Pseudomonadota bacterium]|nr:DUF4157 domain-containing protein [Pseudomonadota bacterium]